MRQVIVGGKQIYIYLVSGLKGSVAYFDDDDNDDDDDENYIL
jgi:hypothetical protein